MIRPPGPLPRTCARSTPRSAAIRLAAGEAVCTRPSAGGVAGVGDGILAAGEDLGDRRLDGVHLALGGDDANTPRGGRLDLDGRLVSLDLDDRLAGADLGAVLDEPAQHLSLFHRDRELRERDRNHPRPSVRSTAAATSSALG
jgi:hypothetical protein